MQRNVIAEAAKPRIVSVVGVSARARRRIPVNNESEVVETELLQVELIPASGSWRCPACDCGHHVPLSNVNQTVKCGRCDREWLLVSTSADYIRGLEDAARRIDRRIEERSGWLTQSECIVLSDSAAQIRALIPNNEAEKGK